MKLELNLVEVRKEKTYFQINLDTASVNTSNWDIYPMEEWEKICENENTEEVLKFLSKYPELIPSFDVDEELHDLDITEYTEETCKSYGVIDDEIEYEISMKETY